MPLQPGVGESCWEIACIECQRLANLRLSLVSILPAEPQSWRDCRFFRQKLQVYKNSRKKRKVNPRTYLVVYKATRFVNDEKAVDSRYCHSRKRMWSRQMKVNFLCQLQRNTTSPCEMLYTCNSNGQLVRTHTSKQTFKECSNFSECIFFLLRTLCDSHSI